MSRDLRKTPLALRDHRLLEAFLNDETAVTGELVFRGPDGGIRRKLLIGLVAAVGLEPTTYGL